MRDHLWTNYEQTKVHEVEEEHPTLPPGLYMIMHIHAHTLTPTSMSTPTHTPSLKHTEKLQIDLKYLMKNCLFLLVRWKGRGLGDISLQPQQLKPVHVCRYMPIWSLFFFLLANTWNNRVKTALSLTPACICHPVFSPMYLLTYQAHWNSHFNLKWVKYTVAFKYVAGFCSSHVKLILIPRCLLYPCIPCWLSDNWFGGDYWGSS